MRARGPAHLNAQQAVNRYVRAWNELNGPTRLRRLEECWAPGGQYLDPTVEAPLVGPEALSAHIASVQRRFPGHEFVLAAPVQEHHARFMFRWIYPGPDEDSPREGVEFGELDDTGRIRSLTGFTPRDTEE